MNEFEDSKIVFGLIFILGDQTKNMFFEGDFLGSNSKKVKIKKSVNL